MPTTRLKCAASGLAQLYVHRGVCLDIEDLLAERGISVSHESIYLWCIKFGRKFARRLKRNHQGYGDTFFIDEAFVKINGKQHYLWRAVDQDGEVVNVFLQSRRDGRAATRFFKRLLRSHGGEPRKIVTDKLRSNDVAHRELVPEMIHNRSQYANIRAELSHQPITCQFYLTPPWQSQTTHPNPLPPQVGD